MNAPVMDGQIDPQRRAREDAAEAGKVKRDKATKFPSSATPLETRLDDDQRLWLTDHCCDLWEALDAGMDSWRRKCEKWERRSDDKYGDRIKESPDPDVQTTGRTVFEQVNNSLGLVSGFADFAYAQAKDDLFGTKPYFAVQPEGAADVQLAELMTRHSNWRFNRASVDSFLEDATFAAINIGTAFPKAYYLRLSEPVEVMTNVLTMADTGEPVTLPTGDYWTDREDTVDNGDGTASPASAPEIRVDAANIAWKQMAVEDVATVYDNVANCLVDFRDIAFNPTAPELTLLHTPVFHRRPFGLLDAKVYFGMTDEQYEAARSLVGSQGDPGSKTPLEHRKEGRANLNPVEDAENPEITLVEGYLRVDPFKNGKPIRIYAVFEPTLRVLFKADYLVNVTPGGEVPIKPVRCYRVPNRIIGKGYHEKFEETNDLIDNQFCAILFRDRLAANPIIGTHRSALEEPEEGNITLAPGKAFALAETKSLKDFVEFGQIPDFNGRSLEILNIASNFVQLRAGITAASQGELKGIPQASTATGVNQIVSRGATLLKWPIDNIKADIENYLNYELKLLYANQNMVETFVWGEGKSAQLLSIDPRDTRDIDLNVTLTMTTSQNQQKLEKAQLAIAILLQYIQVPEPEKDRVKPAFVQALQSLGFRDPESMLRDGIQMTPEAMMASMSPDQEQPAPVSQPTEEPQP